MLSVDSLERLTHGDGAQALAEAMTWEAPGPAQVERLRRTLDATTASAALEVAQARRSLRGRVDAWATYWCDREGAAQASDDASARWKAERFRDAAPIVDLCCGTGADLAAIAGFASARGVDLRPERAWMAGRNANVPAVVGDVTTLRFDERVAHIDPARREEGSARRLHAWQAMMPDGAFILALSSRLDGLMVKLGPGVEIPADQAPAGAELAVLSRGGRLTQAVLTTGSLARHEGRRLAVLLQQGIEIAGVPTWSPGRGDPAWAPCDAWHRYIAEPDASLERTGLLPVAACAEGLHERAAGLGLCTRPEPPSAPSSWFRWFECVESGPARIDHLTRRLTALNAGEVDVKVRGGAADADTWARALRGNGTDSLVVFVHRLGQGAEAVIARRL
jgi:SAM-dependent methyltransferase